MDQPLTAYIQSSGETLCGRRSLPVLPPPWVGCRQSRHHTAPLFGFCNDHFHWVGGRAENRTHLGYVLHDVQQVYGIRITQDENEYVPAGQGLGVDDGGVPQAVIVALCPS